MLTVRRLARQMKQEKKAERGRRFKPLGVGLALAASAALVVFLSLAKPQPANANALQEFHRLKPAVSRLFETGDDATAPELLTAFHKIEPATGELSKNGKKIAKSPDGKTTSVRSNVLMKDLVEKHLPEYEKLQDVQYRLDGFKLKAKEAGVEEGSRKYELLKKQFLIASFLHDFVKAGGMTENVYVMVPGRTRIDKVVNGKRVPLSKLKIRWRMDSGKTIKRPAHQASRLPNEFLKDLFSGKPVYVIGGQNAYNFGDCDELEMGYINLLSYFGMTANLVMDSDIHVVSNVRLGSGELWLYVDNTFNCLSVETEKRPTNAGLGVPLNYKLWWFEKRAQMRHRVTVTPEGRERVSSAVEDWMVKEKSGGGKPVSPEEVREILEEALRGIKVQQNDSE